MTSYTIRTGKTEVVTNIFIKVERVSWFEIQLIWMIPKVKQDIL